MSTSLNLINVHRPTDDNVHFYNNYIFSISKLPGKCVIAGDFNCILDPSEDHTRTRKALHHFINKIHLVVDLWRHLNPS